MKRKRERLLNFTQLLKEEQARGAALDFQEKLAVTVVEKVEAMGEDDLLQVMSRINSRSMEM